VSWCSCFFPKLLTLKPHKMEITKLRLVKLKNGNGLEMSYERPGPNGDKIAVAGENHTALIHNDLYNAIQAMNLHLAMMAFHVKETEVEDIAMPDLAKFKDFSVGSYSISGKEEKRGIIISGTLRKAGKAHNFNTPFYRFEEPESGRYGYMDDLEAKLRVIETEVPLYLDGTKRGEPAQPELGMPENKAKVTKMHIAAPEGGGKVTEEGNLASADNKHKYADKDAMDRVAELGTDGSDGGSKAQEKRTSRKRVQQTSENPSGIKEAEENHG
jgi:hypothetical protein